MFHKIAVGISGGVDSAVAAAVLKTKGFNILGVFMRNWDLKDELGNCSVEKDFEDAEKVCKKLEIPLYRIDFIKQYWNFVFETALTEYQEGSTPNPDVLCNKYIKFDAFFKHCIENLKCDAIATGHYANTNFGPFLENYSDKEKTRLYCPRDKHKDQTFFLSQVSAVALRRTMFPLAGLLKSEVRQIAKDKGLTNVAEKKDSTGICFVGKRHFQTFIEEYIKPKPGNFIDLDTGQIVGQHRGIHNWTVGQRCKLTGYDDAYFIYKKDVKSSDILVVKGTNHLALHSDICNVQEVNWIHSEPKDLQNGGILECEFRFQHTKPLINCRVYKIGIELVVLLNSPFRALTTGQFSVFYKGDECLGSGKICHVGPDQYYLKSDFLLNKYENARVEMRETRVNRCVI